jgi:hypothetical protein
MSRRERRGDWPIDLDVLDEAEARQLTHGTPEPPSRADEATLRSQEEEERKAGGHPSEKHRPDDPNLD